MPQPAVTLAKAKVLRKRMTDAERKLWSVLRNRQFEQAKFRRQVPLDQYVADFASFEYRLVVEVDGGQRNEDKGRVYDEERTRQLEAFGYLVLRFWNNDVLENIDGVALVILEAMQERTLTLSLSRRGRGDETRTLANRP